MKTELLEKTSTPQFKGCCHCREIKPVLGFNKDRSRKDGYDPRCKACTIARNSEWYRKRGGAEVRWKYNHSPRGYALAGKYRQTEKCRLSSERFYAKHGGQAAYEREGYHKIQDGAGCHWEVRSFYPGYRFLKALETAEVVEI